MRSRNYRCWLCGKTLKINTPPYQRNKWSTCFCEEEGRLGGDLSPYNLTDEEVENAIREYLKTVDAVEATFVTRLRGSLPVAKE